MDYSYTVIFEPLEDGGYEVIVPAIPAIVTYGRTLREAKEMALDAIKCHLEGLKKIWGYKSTSTHCLCRQ